MVETIIALGGTKPFSPSPSITLSRLLVIYIVFTKSNDLYLKLKKIKTDKTCFNNSFFPDKTL